MSRIGSNAWCYIRLEIRNTAKPWLLLILLLLHGGLSAGCATTQPPPDVIFVSEQAISDHLALDRSADSGLLDVWQVHGSDSVYVTHHSVRHGGTYRLSSGSPISESVEPRSSSENWIDAHGRVLELPPFARTLKSHGLVTIDRQSGLFISNHRDETNCRVGHMERPDGWLIDMPLEQSGFVHTGLPAIGAGSTSLITATSACCPCCKRADPTAGCLSRRRRIRLATCGWTSFGLTAVCGWTHTRIGSSAPA